LPLLIASKTLSLGVMGFHPFETLTTVQQAVLKLPMPLA